MKPIIVWMAAAMAACTAGAVETKLWTQSEAGDFEKGTLKGLALSSDGTLTLAPLWQRLADAETPLLWSVARDARGVLYAGGGDGKVYEAGSRGQCRAVADLGSGSVYALALGKGGEIYAALSPGGKIFRVDPAGKAAVLAELKARYVWALAWGADGALYAATGDPGQIVRIGQDGKSSVFLDAAESHVRALARDGAGNWIAGTEPGGVVLRVNAAGAGFVLHQTSKREVTAVAVAPDGAIYAAAVGNRGGAPAPVLPPAPAPPAVQAPVAPVQPQAQAAGQGQARVSVAAPPAIASLPQAAGSEIYRIGADGEPRRIWTNAGVTVYALGFDKEGRLIAATGNEGRIYRIDSPVASTRLADGEPQQITALAAGPGGAVYAVSANPGMVFQLGPDLEKSGTIESDVLDAGRFAYWGRLRHEAELQGGRVRLEARSGNVEDPNRNWSPWIEVEPAKGERITAPPARFLQFRATLEAPAGGPSPRLKLVEAAYQAKNGAPVIEKIEITPANYKLPAASAPLSASKTLTLPAMGQAARRGGGSAQPPATESAPVTMNYEKGWLGARWRASDPNGDDLEAKLEIRGEGEREWKPLKDKLRESRYSWDSTGLADGRYRLRLTLSDQPDNYPGQGLAAQRESEEFIIDNTPPRIEGLTARIDGGQIEVRFKATDQWTALEYAEIAVNGGEWVAAAPTTGITDSLEHEYLVRVPKGEGAEFVVAVRVADGNDNVAVQKAVIR